MVLLGGVGIQKLVVVGNRIQYDVPIVLLIFIGFVMVPRMYIGVNRGPTLNRCVKAIYLLAQKLHR